MYVDVRGCIRIAAQESELCHFERLPLCGDIASSVHSSFGLEPLEGADPVLANWGTLPVGGDQSRFCYAAVPHRR
jgi:hypothetical protein